MTDTATGYPVECVTDEAIMATLNALDGDDAEPLSECDPKEIDEARRILAAAAPYIVAHALHHLVDELVNEKKHAGVPRATYLGSTIALLRDRVAALESSRL